ncbi:hypothetical protein Tco_0532601 [Tanacetum coccineum]
MNAPGKSVDSFEEGEIIGESNDGCVKDCMGKKLDDDVEKDIEDCSNNVIEKCGVLISQNATDSSIVSPSTPPILKNAGAKETKGYSKGPFISAAITILERLFSKRFTDLELLWQCKRNYSPTQCIKETNKECRYFAGALSIH